MLYFTVLISHIICTSLQLLFYFTIVRDTFSNGSSQ
jgi:hypothetical protein